MLNKKLHVVLVGMIICFIIIMFVMQALNYINEDLNSQIPIPIGICCVLLFFIIQVRYIRVTVFFEDRLFNSDYVGAEEVLNKYYPRNKTLFLRHRLFYSLAVGDSQSINELYSKYNKKMKYYSKSLMVKTYKILYNFIIDAEIEENLDKIIEGQELKHIKNVCLIKLLYSLKLLEEKKFNEAVNMVEQITKQFYYPFYAFIIYKIMFKANENLGVDNQELKQKLFEVADNDFLKKQMGTGVFVE